MLTMINKESSPLSLLRELGSRLKQARLTRNESQELFSSRLGISRQSYAKMEKGDSSIAIGHWLNASQILGKLPSWQSVLQSEDNLFDQFEQIRSGRQRAGKKRK